MTPCLMCKNKTFYYFDKTGSLWHQCVCGYSSCLTEVQKNGFTVPVRKYPSSRFYVFKDSLPHSLLQIICASNKVPLTFSSIYREYSTNTDAVVEIREVALSIIYLLSGSLIDYVSIVDRKREVSYWQITKKGTEFIQTIV